MEVSGGGRQRDTERGGRGGAPVTGAGAGAARTSAARRTGASANMVRCNSDVGAALACAKRAIGESQGGCGWTDGLGWGTRCSLYTCAGGRQGQRDMYMTHTRSKREERAGAHRLRTQVFGTVRCSSGRRVTAHGRVPAQWRPRGPGIWARDALAAAEAVEAEVAHLGCHWTRIPAR